MAKLDEHTLGDTLKLKVSFREVVPEPVVFRVKNDGGTDGATASRVGSTLTWQASYTTDTLGRHDVTVYTSTPATVKDIGSFIVQRPLAEL